MVWFCVHDDHSSPGDTVATLASQHQISHAGVHAVTAEQRQFVQDRLAGYLAQGGKRALDTAKGIIDVIPHDQVVRAGALDFEDNLQTGVRVQVGTEWRSVHKNALGQLAERADIPMAYVNHLRESDWGRKVLAHNLREAMLHDQHRYLLRTVGGEVRGWLSDRFRRIDSRPIVQAMVEEVQASSGKMVVADGLHTDVRCALRLIRPEVIEVTPGEYVVFGMSWENSDYGAGAMSIRSFLLRVICWNGATMEQPMRHVHLGGRLDESIEFSDRTYQLDSEAMTSAVRDATRSMFAEAKIAGLIEQVRTAATEEVDADKVLRGMKGRLSKDETKQVAEKYSSADVVEVPAGQTRWRLSNALSWLANQVDDQERKIDLQRLAGDALQA